MRFTGLIRETHRQTERHTGSETEENKEKDDHSQKVQVAKVDEGVQTNTADTIGIQ